ncbi:MAG TPA: NADH-quinone oxidoreductase subunit NuoH [Gemmatimonadales bacterium]
MTPALKGLLLVSSIKIVVVFVAMMIGVIMVIWVERRGSAMLQDRLGPNRVGPLGLLQNVADGIKNFAKEEVRPSAADGTLFTLAPAFSFIPSMLLFAVVPFAAPLPGFDVTLPIAGRFVHEGPIAMAVADLPIGFLFIIAISSVAVYGIVLAGWSSNSKYAFLGALRASAQMISYEIALGMALIVVLLLSGNVPLGDVIAAQQRTTWFVLAASLAFILFFIASFAETNRLPFDLPEAEAELVTGYHTEYSSMKFSMFFIAEYAALITMSALLATLFFGGWDIPFVTFDERVPTAWSVGAVAVVGLTHLFFLAKTFVFVWIYIWVRWTLPRFRFDQLMHLGWKILLPVSLGYIMVMAGAVLALDVWGLEPSAWYGLALFAVNVPLVAGFAYGLDRDRLMTGTHRRVRPGVA